METIKAYKTSDGEIFERLEDAKKHQSIIEFDEWYLKHTLFGNVCGSSVDVEDIKDWLKTHKEKILTILTAQI